MNKIFLNDLLQFDESLFGQIKIRFVQSDDVANPLELYLDNPETVNHQWFFWRKVRRYFKVGQIAICLLKIRDDNWLLTTIKEVTEDHGITYGINYSGNELSQYRALYGRVIVKFKKTFQAQGRYYGSIYNELEVSQILPEHYSGEDFPGYDNVRLSWKQLKRIVERGPTDWINALKGQKAVYLITDTSNGKLYVGSATSEHGLLLSRWISYIQTGHGGNVELKGLSFE